MSYCPNCGAAVAADALDCGRCKALFTPQGWNPVPRPPKLEGVRSVGPQALRWIAAGVLYGLLLRVLVTAVPGLTNGAMSVAFLLGTPFAVGAITVYGWCDEKSGFLEWIVRPAVSIVLMLLGCAVTLLEGSICLVMMAPLFLALGSAGGVFMGLLRTLWGWRRSQLGAVAVLPFLLALGDEHIALHERQQELRQSVEVQAPPAVVWQQILNARSIRPDELPFSWTHLIGVPKPLEGVNVQTAAGEVRFSKWERGVAFRGRVTDRQEHVAIRWHYEFDPHSFPEGSMDDHVAIGGRYFDLHDTTFHLTPLAGNRTLLEIVAHYRVSSSVNFYALPVARVLGNDFLHTILGLYQRRSEKAVAGG